VVAAGKGSELLETEQGRFESQGEAVLQSLRALMYWRLQKNIAQVDKFPYRRCHVVMGSMFPTKSECDVDREIRFRLEQNDLTALDLISDCYAADVFGYLVSLLCSRPDAEDVLQDLFATVARKRLLVAKARNIQPYLFRLARNLALNRIKQNRRRRDREQHAHHWVESVPPAPRSPKLDDLEAALSALPEKQRVVIVLKFFQEKSFREIAELLRISENTAASRYRYALQKLKRALGDEIL